MYLIYWTSRDGSGFYEMGSYRTRAAAVRALPAMQAELTGQAMDAATRATIEAGRWTIERVR